MSKELSGKVYQLLSGSNSITKDSPIDSRKAKRKALWVLRNRKFF